MGQLYGLVLAGVSAILILVVSCLIYLKRNNPFIKSRKPECILIQNAAVFCCSILFSIYIGLRPNCSCLVMLSASTINISVLGFIVLIRAYKYCVACRVAILKARFRFNEFVPDWSEPSWLYRNLWITRHKFICRVLITTSIIFTAPLFSYFSPSVHMPYIEKTLTCPIPVSWMYFYNALAAIIVVLYVCIGILIRNSKDAYRLRLETLAQGCIWTAVFFIITAYPFLFSDTQERIVPPIICYMFGLFGTICISNILPLFYAFFKDPLKSFTGSFEQFVTLLESASFRNSFYSYLTLQFCGENLQFYETVKSWKNLTPNDERKRPRALLIYVHFVKEDALCQVNISFDVKENITVNMEKTEIPSDIFDDAFAALLSDMYFNSFVHFRGTPEFVAATTTELA